MLFMTLTLSLHGWAIGSEHYLAEADILSNA